MPGDFSKYALGAPAGEVTFEGELVSTASMNPIQLPRYRVGAGLLVEIWPLPTNTQAVRLGLGPQHVKAGISKVLPNNAAVAIYYRVEQLSEIYLFTSVVGEGITYRVERGTKFAGRLVTQSSQNSTGGSSPSAPSGSPTPSAPAPGNVARTPTGANSSPRLSNAPRLAT